MKRSLIALSVVLAGCATNASQLYSHSDSRRNADRDYAECDYEATRATVSIRSGIEAGWMQGTLIRQCMQLRGYSR